MKGYSELEPHVGGAIPLEAANVVANMQRSKWLISEAMNKKGRESIYSGVSKTPSVNLYEINLRKRRENSLYAF